MVSRREQSDSGALQPVMPPGDAGDSGAATEVAGASEPSSGGVLRAVQIQVRAEIGRRSIPLRDVLDLQVGETVDLRATADEPIDLFVGDRLIARGVVLVVDEKYCVRVTEVMPEAPGRQRGYAR